MEGVYFSPRNRNDLAVVEGGSLLRLILHKPDFEVMRQSLLPNATIWIAPGDDDSLIEFYYVLSGGITLHLPEGDRVLLQGDSFYLERLKQDVRLDVDQPTELLYVVNRPLFDALLSFNCDLSELLKRIDEKDQTTMTHSKKVMRYSVALIDEMGRHRVGVSMDDMVAAALFHDVGKCYVPDEILKKKGALTREEYEVMKSHAMPNDLLRRRFGERVAALAAAHHERLDGSGYPLGLSGDDIPLGSRVIAVADAFDAMTAGRSYSRRKSPEEAVDELCGLSRQYDAEVLGALRALLERGKLHQLVAWNVLDSAPMQPYGI